MMEKSKFKRGVSGKGKTIAGAAMTLAAAVVLTMAPMSQAFAWGYVLDKNTAVTPISRGWHIKTKGEASSLSEASSLAGKAAVARCSRLIPNAEIANLNALRDPNSWLDNHWFNVYVDLDCRKKPKKKPR